MKISLFLVLLLATTSLFAQRAPKAIITVPGMGCEECATIIHERFNRRVDGILEIDIRWKSKTVKMSYVPDRIDVNDIKVILAEIGFDTDEEKADSVSKSRLPKCCQWTPPAKPATPVPAPAPPPPPAPAPKPAVPAKQPVVPDPKKPVTKPAVKPAAPAAKKKG